jgi:PAS domain S-box-containing protein
MEKRFLCKDGSIIWANLTVYPTWRVGEEPNYHIAIIEDIAERKRAEGALLESEIEHKTLIHNIPGMVYRGYPDWSAEIFSSSEELCGYQPDELNAREGGWFSLVHPDDRERIHKEGAELVQKQKRIVQTYRIIDKSAKVRWVEDRKTSLFSEDGAFIGIDGIVLDITERKKAEQALRESEERLRQIASSLREVIWLRDAQTRQVLYANPAFEELTGWTCESFYENQDIVIDAIHPDDKEWVFKALDQRFEGVPFDKEHRIIHLDGSVRWVSSRSFPVRNEAGEVYRWASIMEDITERKRAEEALGLLDKARSAMARELDLSKVIRDIVESIAETFGYTLVSLYLLEDDVLGLQHQVGYEDIIPEIPITKGVMGRVVRTGKPILLRDVNADPDFLRAVEGGVSEVCVPLFSEGEVAGVLNVESMKEQVLSEADLQLMIALSEHVNIAIERARLYAEAKERATRLELVEQVSRRTTAILDLDELLHEAVDLISDAFGYYSTQIMLVEGGEVVITASSHPSLQSVEGHLRLRVGQEGITGWVAGRGKPLLVPNVSLDDRFYFTKEISETKSELAVPIKLKDRVIGVLDVQSAELNAFTQADVSTLEIIADQLAIAIENAKLYQELEARRDLLEHAVEERTAELRSTNEQLRVLSRMKDEFVSNVSHELRTPITNIKLYHNLLARIPQKRERYMDTLQRETGRLEHLVERLLYLACLDQDRLSYTPTVLDLNTLVEACVVDRTALAELQGLTLVLNKASKLPTTQADRGQLEQVISSLLTNALSYTPAGGQVVVTTQTRQFEDEQWVGFSVSDTGPGISPDDQQHLFERFFRGKVGRESGEPGTGLGLAIAKEIIDRHHGEIEVESEGIPGKGATFTVWLPVTPP